MKRWAIGILAVVSFGSFAGSATFQCGPYTFEAIPETMGKINGETVTSQKITVLGENDGGVKVDMGLMPAKDGNNYGFEYIRRPGTEKRFLNVELLRANMDAPRVIGSFPCKKVPDQ